MAKLNFFYGNGKTSEICSKVFDYRAQKVKILILNADNDLPLIPQFNGNNEIEIIFKVDIPIPKSHLFQKFLKYKRKGIRHIFIDNAHKLTREQVEHLCFVVETLKINVNLYGNILVKDEIPDGIKRIMEVSDNITKIDPLFVCKTRIRFFYGAMGSGKTSKLLLCHHGLFSQGKNVVIVRTVQDRDSSYLKSRNGLTGKVDYILNPNDLLNPEDFIDMDHILVDEAQFLSSEQIETLCQISRKYEINLDFYGLRTDFMTNAFPGTVKLFMVADELRKISTVCNCKNNPEVMFNARIDSNGKYIKMGPQVVIDGDNVSYRSMCRYCYIKNVLGFSPSNIRKVIKYLNQLV